jgi:SulP family sulfate permease
MHVLGNIFPFLAWIGELNQKVLKADLVAGLTGAVLVLPQGVAFASIAGLPAQYGLYCAIVPAIVAALFGSSRHLISGPTTAISLVVFSNLSALAAPMSQDYISLALSLALLVGLLQLGLGLARMGVLINFVSHSVMLGFTTGAAILIATTQVKHFFGIELPPGESFIHTWLDFLTRMDETNWRVLSLAGFTFLCALVIKSVRPRYPAMLIAMILGSGLNWLLSGHLHGVALVGALPQTLPPFHIPDLDLNIVRELAPGALAICMLGLTEATSIAKAVAAKSDQRIDNNQEFIGQGLSNIVGSFFSAYASSGSFTRTGVNYESGAKTPLAGVSSALFLAVILLIVTPLMAWLPIPCMAGVILLVAMNLVSPSRIRMVLRTSRGESAVMILTFLATLFFKLEIAVLSGVLLSLILYLERTSHPRFTVLAPAEMPHGRRFLDARHAGLQECPQLMVLRLEGSIFFGAVNYIENNLNAFIQKHPEQRHILIVASGMNFIDVTGCEMLFHENSELFSGGRMLYLCSIKPKVDEVLRRGGCLSRFKEQNIFADKAEAVSYIVPHLDPERCRVCTARVFKECSQMPGPISEPESGQ